MAAAEAFLGCEPFQQLQHENFLLQEENRRVRSEVRELLVWKDKAVAHMAAMAPARRRAAREVERAKQLQQQLRAVENSLQTRGALERATTELEGERDSLQKRVEALKRENAALKHQSERRKCRAEEAEAQLATLGESFRLHLERLVALREKLDGGNQDRDHNAEETLKTETVEAMTPAASRRTSNNAEGELEQESESSPSPSISKNSAALVAGLDVVATKCLTWLQEHLDKSLARQQRKAARYEEQRQEMKQLQEQVKSAGSVPEKLAQDHAKQAREIDELHEANEKLQQRVADAKHMTVVQQQRRENMATNLRLVAAEVRQYLRLIRGEIKRKFGYLPEAIAHAETWDQIAGALDLLLCESRERCILRDDN